MAGLTSIHSLPNEILIAILSNFQAKELLACAAVSRHFYSIVTRAFYRRVLTAASLPSNELILECYHPSAKISTPYLSCQRLGIGTLDGQPMAEECERIGEVQRLYSSFRPVVIESNQRSWRFRTSILNLGAEDDAAQHSLDQSPCPREDIYLDGGELFSQLCTVTNVVREGPRHGLFVSHVNVSDGVIRVWREWLAHRVHNSPQTQESDKNSIDNVLWADKDQHVGLRFRVTLGPSERMPLLSRLGEDEPISYTLEYEELLVRCSQLLLATEKSEVQEIAHSGKAIIISSI